MSALPSHTYGLSLPQWTPARPCLVDILTLIIPAQASILDHLDIQGVFRLSRVCKALEDLNSYQVLLSTRFNINHKLRVFFNDPVAFRNLQVKHNVFIAETWAHHFFARTSPLQPYIAPSPGGETMVRTFELRVQKGANSEAVYQYLAANSYMISEQRTLNHDDPYMHKRMLVKKSVGHVLLAITVRETIGTPLASILSSPLTSGFCFITWEKAYHLFPRATFIQREAYLTVDFDTITDHAGLFSVWKSLGLGIKPLYVGDVAGFGADYSKTRAKAPVPLGYRTPCDSSSWEIPLATDGISPSSYPPELVDLAGVNVQNGWNGWNGWNNGHVAFYHVDFDVVASKSLRYQYIWNFNDRYVKENVERRFEELTTLEMSQLQRQHRPLTFGQIVTIPADFVQPDYWTYYDDDMLHLVKVRSEDPDDGWM